MHGRTLLGGAMAVAAALAVGATGACGAIANDVAPADADAEADARPRSEAGKPDSGVEVPPPIEECHCMCDDIDATTFPWKPPSVAPGSCTVEELDALVAFVDGTSDPQKWKDGPWTTSDVCRDCVFAKESETWPPLVLGNSGQFAELNVGGCIAIASGIEACGKAYQQWRTCYLEVCTGAECGAGDFTKCVAAANTKVCKKAYDAVFTSCGGAQGVAAAEAACEGAKYVFEGPIRAQCIGLGGGGDGGP